MYFIATLVGDKFFYLCQWKDELLWADKPNENTLTFDNIEVANAEIWNLKKYDREMRDVMLLTVGEYEQATS